MRIYKGNDPTARPSKLSGSYMGEAFTGKTHNLCTWHTKEGVILLIAFDPDTGTARSMPNTVVVEVESFKEFETDVMPYVRARELDKLIKDKAGIEARVDTLALDTISVAATRCQTEIQGIKPQMTQQDWGLLLNRLTSTTMQCIDITREYTPGQRTYHCLFASHLKTETSEGGGVVGYRPAVSGQFKDIFPRLGGFSFICRQSITQGLVSGKPQQSRTFYVHTCPPTDMYICGDRIGGEGKLYKPLAPTMSGTYPALMEAWGMDPEPPSSPPATPTPTPTKESPWPRNV